MSCCRRMVSAVADAAMNGAPCPTVWPTGHRVRHSASIAGHRRPATSPDQPLIDNMRNLIPCAPRFTDLDCDWVELTQPSCEFPHAKIYLLVLFNIPLFTLIYSCSIFKHLTNSAPLACQALLAAAIHDYGIRTSLGRRHTR